MSTTTESRVHGPTTVVLTDEGTSWFVTRNQRLQRLQLITGREEYGLQMRDYHSSTLAALVARGLVQIVQHPIVDAFSDRRSLLELVTESVRAHVLHGASEIFLNDLSESTLGATLRRANPRHWIGAKDREPAVARFLAQHANLIDNHRSVLASRIISDLRAAAGRGDTTPDRAETREAIATILKALPGAVWVVLATHDASPRRAELVDAIAATARATYHRYHLADYLALVWAEVSGYIQMCAECDPPPVQLLLQFVRPGGLRGAPLSAAAASGGGRINMMVATGDVRLDALRDHLEDIAGTTHDGELSFEQFYQSADAGQTNLGLYYLSFLEEACKRIGVPCRSYVRGARSDGRFYMTLAF